MKNLKNKLCGCQESCFVDGEDCWGHMGGVLCKHTAEVADGDGVRSICMLTDEDVRCYTTKTEYEAIQQEGEK